MLEHQSWKQAQNGSQTFCSRTTDRAFGPAFGLRYTASRHAPQIVTNAVATTLVVALALPSTTGAHAFSVPSTTWPRAAECPFTPGQTVLHIDIVYGIRYTCNRESLLAYPSYTAALQPLRQRLNTRQHPNKQRPCNACRAYRRRSPPLPHYPAMPSHPCRSRSLPRRLQHQNLAEVLGRHGPPVRLALLHQRILALLRGLGVLLGTGQEQGELKTTWARRGSCRWARRGSCRRSLRPSRPSPPAPAPALPHLRAEHDQLAAAVE